MSQLKITIKGISLCSFDESISNWRIFVPLIIEDHSFSIKVVTKQAGQENVEEIFTVDKGTKVKIANNGASTTGTHVPVLLSDTLNISDFHREDIPLVSDINKYAAFVTLSGFTLESAPADAVTASTPADPNVPTVRFYDVYKMRPGGSVLFKKDVKAHPDIFTILTANQGTNNSITADGKTLKDLPQQAGVDYEVVLDNDCHQTHTEPHPQTDFRFYYNIIDKDRLIDPCEYEIRPVPFKCLNPGCDSTIANKVLISDDLNAHLNS